MGIRTGDPNDDPNFCTSITNSNGPTSGQLYTINNTLNNMKEPLKYVLK